jgi:hypothetical protein
MKAVSCSVVVLSLLTLASAHAGEVKVYALGTDKATLAVNRAKPKMFRAGQSPTPGLKLIGATSRYATIDVNGSRVKLALGERANFRATE